MEKKPAGSNSVDQDFWNAYQRYVHDRGISEKTESGLQIGLNSLGAT